MAKKVKKIFLDPKQPPKKLWRNLNEIGMTNSTDSDILYSADELNNSTTQQLNNSTTQQQLKFWLLKN
jgi:hypothetical protein